MSITEARQARVRAALAQRLGSVVVVAEAINRRHNTSAILRSAECFGVHEVHLVTGGFRASKGAARGAERWLELVRHDAIEPCVAGLKARGFTFLVGDLSAEAWSPDTVPIEGPIAVLFGSEMSGVSDAARALADGVLCVPMRGLTESLNVSVAAACTLQRLCERRRDHVGGGDLAPARQQAFYDAWLARESAAERGMAARVGGSAG